MCFFESKRELGGRGVKEKNKDSDNVAAKDVVVPLVVDEPAVTVESGRKSVKFRTLITPAGNGTDVAIPLESIRAISKRFYNTAYGFFLGKRVAYPVVANYVRNTWVKHELVKYMLNSSTEIFSFQFNYIDGLDAVLGMSSYARALIEVQVDVELKDDIVVPMPKLVGEGFYTCTVRVAYEYLHLKRSASIRYPA
ncbi:hypothetical protein Tco_1519465 [Tanacetum coccineum]